MNKYEKALNVISQNLQLVIHDDDGLNPEYSKEQVYALTIAVETLEKQIPKKPIPNSHDMFGIKCCICPVCSCHVYSTSNSFCHRCGRALDWSDKE